ncbi:hypothetical protein R3P38DRAFT_3190620 [Favolaschia claudopus]|uniref:Uncharacterized protein n=1 Tax=Favolaschia claudopus TaxID=2862362 RepID=A0AAW0BNW6_9AGAR
MSTAATALITTHIPYLASTLRRYDGEITDLQHQREHLQSEITRVKRSIKDKQSRQKEVAKQIEDKEQRANGKLEGGLRATAGSSKRPRNTTREEQENERPPLRRRVEDERRFIARVLLIPLVLPISPSPSPSPPRASMLTRSQNADLRRSDSQVSMGARRRGRHFTNEEMRRATNTNTTTNNNKTNTNA